MTVQQISHVLNRPNRKANGPGYSRSSSVRDLAVVDLAHSAAVGLAHSVVVGLTDFVETSVDI